MPLLTLTAPSSSERAKALVFEDSRSQALLEQIRRVAGSEAPVLLLGEPGTGRELLARYQHDLSLRRTGPFLTITCSAFTAQALEAEIFGQEREAYPGAGPARSGVLENAGGGTVFFDGLAELNEGTQLKLLRALQEHRLRRVGARRYRHIDVRIIIAGAPDLDFAVASKVIRADLWRLLSVHRIEVPPLRERPRDILPLARHFLQMYQQRIGIGSRALDEQAEQALLGHTFPDNIRELENAIHHAILRARGRFISKADLALDGNGEQAAEASDPWSELEPVLKKLFDESPPKLHELIEEAVLRSAYRYSGYNQLKTARILGMSRNVVRARLVQYGEVAGLVRASHRTPVHRAKLRAAPRARPLVRIGYQRVGVLGLLRASGTLEAAFAEVGYAVEWRHFPSGVRLIEAFRDNDISLGVVGECPPIFAQANAVPVVYVAAESPAPEGVALIVPSGSPIRNVAGLRKKRVAVMQGSNSHYLLIRALEEAGVDYSDVILKFSFSNSARLAFQHREVDAWAVADPTLADVQQSLAVRVLRDGRGLAMNQAYYLANREFTQTHSELIQIFQRELTSAQNWVREHLDDAAESLAPRLGMAQEAINLCLKRRLWQNLGPRELLSSQQRIADAFFGMKLIPRAISVMQASWALPEGALEEPPDSGERTTLPVQSTTRK